MVSVEERLEALYGLTKHLEKGIVSNQEVITVLIKQQRAYRDVLMTLVCKVYGLDIEEAKNFLKIDPDGFDDK